MAERTPPRPAPAAPDGKTVDICASTFTPETDVPPATPVKIPRRHHETSEVREARELCRHAAASLPRTSPVTKAAEASGVAKAYASEGANECAIAPPETPTGGLPDRWRHRSGYHRYGAPSIRLARGRPPSLQGSGVAPRSGVSSAPLARYFEARRPGWGCPPRGPVASLPPRRDQPGR